MKFGDWSLIGDWNIVNGQKTYLEDCKCTSKTASYYRCPSYMLNFFKNHGLLQLFTEMADKSYQRLVQQKAITELSCQKNASMISNVVFSLESDRKRKAVQKLAYDPDETTKTAIEKSPKTVNLPVLIKDSLNNQMTEKSIQSAIPSNLNHHSPHASSTKNLAKKQPLHISSSQFKKKHLKESIHITKSSRKTSQDCEESLNKSEVVLKTMDEIENYNEYSKTATNTQDQFEISEDHTKKSVFLSIPKIMPKISMSKFRIEPRGPQPISFRSAISQIPSSIQGSFCLNKEESSFVFSHLPKISANLGSFIHPEASSDSRPRQPLSERESLLRSKIKPLTEFVKQNILTKISLAQLQAAHKAESDLLSMEKENRRLVRLNNVKKEKAIFERFEEFPQLKSTDDLCKQLESYLRKEETKEAIQNQRKRMEHIKKLKDKLNIPGKTNPIIVDQ